MECLISQEILWHMLEEGKISMAEYILLTLKEFKINIKP